MANYTIETGHYGDGGAYVCILSDDEDILDNEAAMAAVGKAVRRAFGPHADTVGRGSSHYDDRGREAGWEWSVVVQEGR